MDKLIAFEIKKFIKQRKNIILIITILLLTGTYAFYCKYLDKANSINEIRMEEFNIESLKQALNNIDESDSENPVYKNFKSELDLRENKLTALRSNNWKEALEKDIDIYNLMLSTNSTILGSVQSLKWEITKNQYLIDNNIKPINDEYSTEAINFTKNIIKVLFPTLIIFFIIIINSDIISKEYDFGTIQILMYQIKSRKKIFLYKFLFILALDIIIILFLFLFFFIINTLINGFGNFNYPLMVIEKGNYILNTQSYFLSKNIILIILSIIFLSSLTITISSISENSINAITISITTILILFILEYIINAP